MFVVNLPHLSMGMAYLPLQLTPALPYSTSNSRYLIVARIREVCY